MSKQPTRGTPMKPYLYAALTFLIGSGLLLFVGLLPPNQALHGIEFLAILGGLTVWSRRKKKLTTQLTILAVAVAVLVAFVAAKRIGQYQLIILSFAANAFSLSTNRLSAAEMHLVERTMGELDV